MRISTDTRQRYAPAGGSGVCVLGPRLLQLPSMNARMSVSDLPWVLICATSRVTPVQMSQPKLIGSTITDPSGRISWM